MLNTPSYAWSFGSGLRTSLKDLNGYAYVLAMTDGGSRRRAFALPQGVDGRSAEVVGEQRSIPITDGRFEDTFAGEFSHHIYRIMIWRNSGPLLPWEHRSRGRSVLQGFPPRD